MSAIEKYRMQQRSRSLRISHEIAKKEHTLFTVGAAALLGMADATGKRIPLIMGVDGKIPLGVGCLVAAGNAGPEMAKYLQSAADALLSLAAHEYGKMAGAAAIKQQQATTQGVGEATAMEALLSQAAESAD